MEEVYRSLNEGVNARDIKRAIIDGLFHLKETGQADIVFGDRVGQTFTAYLVDENTVGVDYLGKHSEAKCRDIYNDNALVASIQMAFIKVYV